MKKRGLTRFQLTLLILLALLVFYRWVAGPPDPKGLVVLVDLKPFALRHAAFELDRPAEVYVQATGSFEDAAGERATPSLAAYGWLLRRADREVVWQMDPARAERGRGTAARVPGDTFALEAGLYDVYFAGYGNTSNRNRRQRWRSDDDQWQFVLRLVDKATPARAMYDVKREEDTASSPCATTSLAPLGDNQEASCLFEVRRPTQLHLYAVGEIGEEPHDYAWIEDATTGTRVWQMTSDNTEPAGGLASNRRFRGDLPLAPGTYRAVAMTDQEHAYWDWQGNPPFDPEAWGLTLSDADDGAVAPFDPWTSRKPLISFTEVPDDAERSQRFAVQQPLQVVLYGVGEITNDASVYDYAELLKEEADRKRTLWKMSRAESTPAGGGSKNRLQVAFLRLEPGVYTLRYETDGSHAYDDWNDDAPDYPERWGVTLFPMATTLDPGVVQLLPDGPETAMAPNAPPPMRANVKDGETLLAWTRLDHDVNKTLDFELAEAAALHVVALGEITRSGQHDYGWIERADDGAVVWEMTLDNTAPAGGDDRNRRFDAVVKLPAGRYVARFKTDFSHHFGDFGDQFPDEAEAWGMTIHFVLEETPPPAVDN